MRANAETVTTTGIQLAKGSAEHNFGPDSVTLFGVEPSRAACTQRGFGRSSLMLVTPAWAQTSSLSPPGDPPTPSAATISSPTLIATAPGSSAMSGGRPRPGPRGVLW